MLITPAQAASVAGVPRTRIYAWIRTGRLPAFRIGERAIRIAPADLERAMVERPQPPAPRKPQTQRRAAPRAPKQGPPRTDVTAWIDAFYSRYNRIPPRDEIWHAFQDLTKLGAEWHLRDARERLWRGEP